MTMSTRERERERERALLPGKYCSRISHLKQIWIPLYGDILHVITENNKHDRFAVALERFQRWHGTRWRDYLLDNCKSSIPGRGLEVPCMYTFVGSLKMIKWLVKVFTNLASTVCVGLLINLAAFLLY